AGPLFGAAQPHDPRQALARREEIPPCLVPPATDLWVVRRVFRHNTFERCQSTPRRAERPVRHANSSTHGVNYGSAPSTLDGREHFIPPAFLDRDLMVRLWAVSPRA